MTKKQTTTYTSLKREDIVSLLNTSDKAVCRALVVLHSRQTDDERDSQSTRHTNGRGFSQFDAAFLSSLAEQYERRGSLSPKQIACARKKVVRYAGQLLEEADAKAQREAIQLPPTDRRQLATAIESATTMTGLDAAVLRAMFAR